VSTTRRRRLRRIENPTKNAARFTSFGDLPLKSENIQLKKIIEFNFSKTEEFS